MIFKPKTKEELRKAIEEYCENDDQKYGNINDWDVSLITDMSNLFFCCFENCNKKIHHFNQPINNWNVSNVTNMNSMFYESNKIYRQKFYMMNIEKENRYALFELQKDISIVKIYYMAKDKKFIMDNIIVNQKNKIQKFIDDSIIDICELCFMEVKCINNVCGLCY